MKKKNSQHARKFWNDEYQNAQHLQMSTEASSDMLAFLRWSDRQKDETQRVVDQPRVLDIGCGNGRNLHFLEHNSRASVFGFDISSEAIIQAQKNTKYPNHFMVHSLGDMPYPYEDNSMDLVLDMMSSHILNTQERLSMRQEIDRILEPGGWIFYKTFLLDGDKNAREMINRKPGDERNSYIHPRIGHTEYVLTEQEIIQEVEAMGWEIHKISKSHKHIKKGQAQKRRNISLYIQKPYDW